MTNIIFLSREKNWIAYWNRALVFLFITTYFWVGLQGINILLLFL